MNEIFPNETKLKSLKQANKSDIGFGTLKQNNSERIGVLFHFALIFCRSDKGKMYAFEGKDGYFPLTSPHLFFERTQMTITLYSI